MSMALTLRKFLADKGVAYDVLPHHHTESSIDTAQAAHVPMENLAKPVVLEDEDGYLMAVIPATHHLNLDKLNHVAKRHLGFATEVELEPLFSDCELGAIPPVGEAYGMQTIVDDSLNRCKDIYIESGDHKELVHLRGKSFQRMMKNTQHAGIS